MSLWHPSIILLFVFNASLLSISTRGFRLTLYIYFPSLKNERKILETKMWVLGSRTFFFHQVLSCPLCSTPTKVTWPLRDAAMTANDLNCPDRSKDPIKTEKTMTVLVPRTPVGTRELQFLSHLSYAEPSSATLPRSCCTCICLCGVYEKKPGI